MADSDVYCLSKLNDNHTVLAAGAATGEAIGFGFDPALALRLHWWTAGAHQREDSVWGARHARAHLGPVADGPEEGNDNHTVLAAGAATGEAIGFGFDPALALRLHWWTAGAHQREDSVWGARHARAHLGPVADGPEEGNEQQQ